MTPKDLNNMINDMQTQLENIDKNSNVLSLFYNND
jgi:hypothetical protein